MKKISLFVFIFLFLTNTSYAVVFKDVASKAPYLEEINNLTELGIMHGNDQKFRPNETITRAEFAAVLCRALKLDTDTAEMKKQSGFTDVKHDFWALPYINAVVKYGIVKGFDNGTFRPNAPVTNEQVIKMIVAGWGFTEEAERLGGYPNGYFEVAKRYGITDKVLFNYRTPSKRFVVAMFTSEALNKFNTSIDKQEVKQQEFQPIPEQVAVDDPVKILSNVTLKSASLERTIIEQPSKLNNAPFYTKDKKFIYKYSIANKTVNISIFGNGKTIYLSKNMANNSVNCAIPEGRWQFVFYTLQNHIKDTYFGYVKVDAKGNLAIENDLWRYTSLQLQPKVIEETKDINSFAETFLKATAKKSDDGKIEFVFTGDSLPKGRRLSINISYELAGNISNESADFVGGKDQTVHFSSVLPPLKSYFFQSTIVDDYGQETIKGELEFDSVTEELLIKGVFHKFISNGFVFID